MTVTLQTLEFRIIRQSRVTQTFPGGGQKCVGKRNDAKCEENMNSDVVATDQIKPHIHMPSEKEIES